jgi:hypothetical protein
MYKKIFIIDKKSIFFGYKKNLYMMK